MVLFPVKGLLIPPPPHSTAEAAGSVTSFFPSKSEKSNQRKSPENKVPIGKIKFRLGVKSDWNWNTNLPAVMQFDCGPGKGVITLCTDPRKLQRCLYRIVYPDSTAFVTVKLVLQIVAGCSTADHVCEDTSSCYSSTSTRTLDH